eukprot:s351_g19.t1
MECPAYSDLRNQYQETFAWMTHHGVEWHELPVIHQHEQMEWVRLSHSQQQAPDMSTPMYNALHRLDMNGHMLRFYTDGSCMHPASVNTRYSAYSMVVDLASDDDERAQYAKQYRSTHIMPPTLQLINACRTSGTQHIHRAELAAVLYICARFFNTAIYSDSAVTLYVVARCLQADTFGQLHDLDNLDLVFQLWCTIHVGRRSFHKVKAHSEDATGLTWIDLYHSLGNKKANDSAITACLHLLPSLVDDYQRLHAEVTEHRYHLLQLYHFHLAVRNRNAETKALTPPQVQEPNQVVSQRHQICERLQQYQVMPFWSSPPAAMNELAACAWGPTMARLIDGWMRQIRWPIEPVDSGDQALGTTWIEMVLSFTIYSQCFLPVKRASRDGVERLVAISSEAEVQALGVKLSEWANWFSIACKQICDLQDPSPMQPASRGLVRSLYTQGASIFSSGFFQRLQLPCQREVALILHVYLAKHKGPAFPEVPPLNVNPNADQYHVIHQELAQRWTTRSNLAHQAIKRVSLWKNNRQRQLQFR